MLKPGMALTTRAGAGQVGGAGPELRQRLLEDEGGRVVAILPLEG